MSLKRTIASGEVNIDGRLVAVECYLRSDSQQVVKVGTNSKLAQAGADSEPFDFRAELKAELERVRNRR